MSNDSRHPSPPHPNPLPEGEGAGAGEARAVVRVRDGRASHETDHLALEEPLEIRVRGRAVSVTMRTPGHDDELAAGFLLSEGIIAGSADVIRVEPCDRTDAGNVVNVVLEPTVHVDFDRLTRHVFASSSCGLCGKASIEAVHNQFKPVDAADVTVGASLLLQLPGHMYDVQSTFHRTGGLHAAALFDTEGKLIVLREDVGRHNAVDKVLGFALLSRLLPLERHVLLVSGRASFEIVQKALAGRVPIIAAVSAPSSLAMEFAEASNQTLVGFLREGRMNVYAHPRRLRGLGQLDEQG